MHSFVKNRALQHEGITSIGKSACRTSQKCSSRFRAFSGIAPKSQDLKQGLIPVSALESPATDSKQAEAIENDQDIRINSNSHASSSNGGSNGVYRSNETGVPPTSKAGDAIGAELQACDELDDILEIVRDEGDLMSGSNWAAALKRLACVLKLRKGQKAKQKQDIAALNKSQDFALLLLLVQDRSFEMSAGDIADCLWALASMDLRPMRLVRHLQREVDLRVADMTERELATVAWSFASLRHSPGPVLDRLAEAALPRLSAFETRGLSMMLWAFSKLEHPPPTDFLEQTKALFGQNFPTCSSQSIANIVYAFGKLREPLAPSLCQQIEDAVTASGPQSFQDSEAANILYGFVRMSFQAPKLVALLEDRIARTALKQEGSSMVWSTLIWGAASLGLPVQKATLDALQQWGLKDPASYSPSSICNLAWGLALLGEVSHPVFPMVIDAAVKSHQKRTLEPRLMRQVFQAVSTARILGAEVTVPSELEQTAYKWWRKGTLSKSMSMTHEAVARAVKKLGLNSAAQHNAGYGLPIVDVAIEAEDEDVALLVDPPADYSSNPGPPQPLGRIKASQRLLQAVGWKVLVVPASTFTHISSDRAVLRTVGQILENNGIQTDWASAVQSAPRSVPRSIASNPNRWADEEDQEVEAPAFKATKVPVPIQQSAEPPVRGAPQPDTAEENILSELAEEIKDSGDNFLTEAQLEKQARDRARQEHVSKEMEGDFMEDWVSLSSWRALKKVVPAKQQS